MSCDTHGLSQFVIHQWTNAAVPDDRINVNLRTIQWVIFEVISGIASLDSLEAPTKKAL